MARVYLDHNATSPLRPEARAEWERALDALGGNPSSLHEPGRRARHELDLARERVAAALDVHEDEVVFTSGGTESDNLAVLGAVRAAGGTAGFVTTAAEHSAVLEPARQLAREGHRVLVLPVDAEASVAPTDVVQACARVDAALVSIVGANNEVGTVAPLQAIRAALSTLERRPTFHTDLVQALGRAEFQLREWSIDLASFSAHKVGGPVGVGVLYRRRGVALQPLLFGGSQEGGLRPGTENVAAIASAACAIELAVAERATYARTLRTLQRDLWNGLATLGREVRLLGPPLESAQRLPGTLTVWIAGVEGKVLVTRLDVSGLEASAGSACASGSLEPSHVLQAMGLDENVARAGLRLSLGRTTTTQDVQRAVDILRRTLGEARAT